MSSLFFPWLFFTCRRTNVPHLNLTDVALFNHAADSNPDIEDDGWGGGDGAVLAARLDINIGRLVD